MELEEAVEAVLDDLRRRRALGGPRELDDVVGALRDRGRVLGLGLPAALGRRPALPRAREPMGRALARRLPRMEREQLGQRRGHVGARHDRVAEPVLQEKLRALEARGELLSGGLLDHARAGEGHKGARLREDDVALHGEARRDAARRGVGEHADVEKPRLGVAPHGGRDLGHLHKGGHALLHAGPARDREPDDGKPEPRGLLEHAAYLLADGRAHGAHHEVRVHEEERALHAADAPAAADHGVVLARGLARGLELLGIARETEEVVGAQAGVPLLEAPRVHRHAHPRAPRHAQVLAAARADLQARPQVRLVDGAATARALDEHVARGKLGADLGHGRLERVQRVRDPTAQHRCAPSGRCGSCRKETPRWKGSAAEGRCSPRRPRSRARPAPSASF